MDFQAPHHTRGSHRRGSALILAAIVAALTMAIAAPAQATPSLAKAWGWNQWGQLGDGTNTGPEECGPFKQACSTTPVAVSNLSGVTAVAGGPQTSSRFSLALLEGGKVMAWGTGVLGRGNESEKSDVPVPVCAVSAPEAACPTGPYLEGVTAISAGEVHALALLNGTVVAWGNNPFGQLGTGEGGSSKVPAHVCAAGATAPCSEESRQLKGVIAIAAGGEHSLALLSNHTVVAWGEGSLGALGTGTTKSSGVAVPVCEAGYSGPTPCSPEHYLSKVIAIAAGYRHSLALLEGGSVVAWGENGYGALGDGTSTGPEKCSEAVCSKVPIAVSGLSGGVTAISAGEHHSLALLSGGTVKAWGSNEAGQLGDGTNSGPEACGISGACSTTPVAVCSGELHPGPCPEGQTLNGVSAIAAGGKHSVALVRGRVKDWGANGQGQLGDATSQGPEACTGIEPVCSTTPVFVSKIAGATKGIAGGGLHSLAFGSPPAVTKLIPKKGPASGGTTVTITGTDFAGVTEVKFGSTSASSFGVPTSATEMTAVSPAEPVGTVDLTVTNSWGTSAVSLADHFTFVPTVTNVSPNAGSTAGGTSVTITGSGFVLGKTATKFKFDSKAAKSVNCTSTTTCTAVSPAHEAGTVHVTATVSKVSSTRNPADQFTYS
jgi:alpha-tubulin suppressor-like RCC1 family protein